MPVLAEGAGPDVELYVAPAAGAVDVEESVPEVRPGSTTSPARVEDRDRFATTRDQGLLGIPPLLPETDQLRLGDGVR
jgi:hypothetical protein